MVVILFRRFWKIWKQFGLLISDFVARIVLTVFYFTLFLPFGLLVRFFSDPLSLKPDKQAQWLDRETHDLAIENARRPY